MKEFEEKDSEKSLDGFRNWLVCRNDDDLCEILRFVAIELYIRDKKNDD